MAISGEKQGNSGLDKPVQDRLLDAAEQLFSEHGFEGASVREIAAAAGCNIASVNYYFGGKDKLYTEVWRRHLLQMRDARLQAIEQVMFESDGKPVLEELLRSFANAFLGPFRDEIRSRRFMNLMAREMIDQRVPVNLFIDVVVKPTMGAVRAALLSACPGLEASMIPLLIVFLSGQLMHVVHIKAMFEKVEIPEMSAFDLNESVEHIVRFSSAGIRAYANLETK